MGVLLALSTLFIWGRLVNIDYDLKDISKELKKMNERRNDGRQIFIPRKADLKKDSCYECAQGTDSPFSCEYGGCRVAKATRVAIKALEEVEQYRAIGTPEGCLRNKDFLRFLANSMNQKKYETYLGIYNAVEKDGRDEG